MCKFTNRFKSSKYMTGILCAFVTQMLFIMQNCLY